MSVFNDNEIINSADRYAIDEWCSRHIMRYISINDIENFLNNGKLPYLCDSITLLLYVKGEKSTKYSRTYPPIHLNKENELILVNDIYQNILIYNTDNIPDFIKFKYYPRLNIDFNNKLKEQYNVEVEPTIKFFSDDKSMLINSIMKEYERI